MKPDFRGQILRWTTAWFLFGLVLLFLYLVGTAQSFLEPDLATLFSLVKWSAWTGTLASWLVVAPLVWRTSRWVSALVLGLGFTLVFAFVLFWGSWVYPDAGILPW